MKAEKLQQSEDILFKLLEIIIELDGKIVYLSGKITGLSTEEVEKNFNQQHFHAATLYEPHLHGFFKPTQWISEKCDWQTAMRLCLAVLPLCQTIIMQPNWKDSNGARLEHKIAKKLGLEIVYMEGETNKIKN